MVVESEVFRLITLVLMFRDMYNSALVGRGTSIDAEADNDRSKYRPKNGVFEKRLYMDSIVRKEKNKCCELHISFGNVFNGEKSHIVPLCNLVDDSILPLFDISPRILEIIDGSTVVFVTGTLHKYMELEGNNVPCFTMDFCFENEIYVPRWRVLTDDIYKIRDLAHFGVINGGIVPFVLTANEKQKMFWAIHHLFCLYKHQYPSSTISDLLPQLASDVEESQSDFMG